MSAQETAVPQALQTTVAATAWRTAEELKAMRQLVKQVSKDVMQDGVHFGTIPGCDKPSLWKPGAEVLFATFRIAADPVVTNLSTPEEVRYQVMVYATSASGQSLGSSVGECSSNEDKYKWRKAMCSEEFESTPEDRRRMKWKRGKREFYQAMQVRAEMADTANTVLRMAHKRGFVALALQVTACSDVFTQGIEDLPDEVREDLVDEYTQDTGNQSVDSDLPTEIRRKSPQTVSTAQPSTASREVRSVAGTGAGLGTEPVPPQRSAAHAPASSARGPQAVEGAVVAGRASSGATAPPPRQQFQQVPLINDAQSRRFYAIWKSAGKSREEVQSYLRDVLNIASGDDREMPVSVYKQACAWAEKRTQRSDRW